MQSTERWLPVVGYEEFYEVSDAGRVRRGTRHLKLSPGNHGRYSVELWRDGARVRRLVHRLVLEAFVGPAPEGTEACHNNGDCLDNRAENLRWDTHSANILDAVKHGTHNHSRVTQCPRGHELAEWNNRPHAVREGFRSCRACGTETSSACVNKRTFDPKRADEHYQRYAAEAADRSK